MFGFACCRASSSQDSKWLNVSRLGQRLSQARTPRNPRCWCPLVPQLVHRVPRGAPGDVVDQQRARRAAVVGARDRAKRFLAGRVPNLELDVPSVNANHARPELHAYGQVVHRLETLVGELEE